MTLDSNGLIIDSLDDIYNRLSRGIKNIYGEINLEPSTPDGQRLSIIANMYYDLQLVVERILQDFDPDFAEGYALDKILKLIASTRKSATKSTVDVNITTNNTVYLDENYTIKDTLSQEWVISKAQTIPSGTTLVSFKSAKWGAVSAKAGSINDVVTVVLGVVSVSNPNDAVVGVDEESDAKLRQKRNKILSKEAYSTINSIESKIIELNGVLDVVIYENDTSEYNPILDLNAHAIWVIVDGGDISDIAKIIALDKTVGCMLKGDIESTYIETIQRQDGTTREHTHIVRFDRPTDKDIYVTLTVKRKNPTNLIDHDAIKAALVSKKFNIAESIVATELYADIYSAGTNYYASDLLLSIDGVNWVDDVLDIGYSDRAMINTINITITEI